MVKRYIAVLLVAALCLAPAAGTAGGPEGVLRLHVVANSDSAADQQLKLLVRDALLSCEGAGMLGAQHSAGAEAQLIADGAKLQATAEAVLQEAGAGYGAKLAIGEYGFPTRQYAGITYPAGSYRALRVVLGEGKGKNWWCVMFPPLCILETEEGEIDIEDIKLSSYLIKLLKRVDGGRLWARISGKR